MFEGGRAVASVLQTETQVNDVCDSGQSQSQRDNAC